MADPINIDGVMYEELGNGQLRVVGYADAPSPAKGRVFTLPDSQETIDDRNRQGRKDAIDAAKDGRDQTIFNERNRPKLPEGYMLGPDGQTAVRVPGLPPAANAGGAQKKPEELAAVRAEALDKIRLARSLQGRSRDGWFTTGLGANLAAAVGATGAYDVKQDTETLKNAGALTRIMEMAKANGGKNPLTPLSNADFQALSSSLANLDTSQSDAQYQANVQRVVDLYTQAYQGAGGADLEGDLDPSTRRNPVAVGPSGGSGPGSPLLNSNAPTTLATGAYKTERDPTLKGVNARVASMLTSGASDQAIRDYLEKSGSKPDPASVGAVLQFRKQNPTYKGGYKIDLESRDVPTTGWNRFAASPTGTGLLAGVDAATGGLTDEFASLAGGGDLDDLNARKQVAFAANPKAAFAGQALGAIGSMSALGAAGRFTGLASRFPKSQLIGDVAFGAASGAGQSNDNRLLGATLGAAGGAGGHYAGQGLAAGVGAFARTRPGAAAADGLRYITGRSPLERAPRLTPGEHSIVSALDRAGMDNVSGSLNEAQNLGVPMSLADTDPNLRELAAAGVRRSPTASAFAEDTLIPRNRGQYDRFTGAVDQNLGPTANIPQLSADLTQQARTSASGLYESAYVTPVASTPELEALLSTPFGRQALSRARMIAANERRDPTAMGFLDDTNGGVVLDPALPGYTTQTLDYVKRGMDDVLEEQRNPITGRLVLDEAGRAQSQVRGQLLDEVDRVNPDFAAARNG